MVDVAQVRNRIINIREWLRKEAPECFIEQRHCEEGTQERIYWHHGYMMGLSDALRFIIDSPPPNQHSRIRDKSTESFLV